MSRLLTAPEKEKVLWDNWGLYAKTLLMSRMTAFPFHDDTLGDLVVYCAADGIVYYNLMSADEAGIVAEVGKPEYSSPGGSIVEILEDMARNTVELGTNLVYGAGAILAIYLLVQLVGLPGRR